MYSRAPRCAYRLTNRPVSAKPSRMRPMRVDLPRSRASWPSALSSTSEMTKSATPIALSQGREYQKKWPAATPRMRLASVTLSAETPVGASVLAIHHPTGRKNRRSAHSSTTGPLLAYTGAGLFEHRLHRPECFHRLLIRDDERRVDAHLGVVDHRDPAAREQRVENPARHLLIAQCPRPGHHETHGEHETPAAHVADDRNLILPALHFGQHHRAEPAARLDQILLDNRSDRDVGRRRRERVAAIARRAAARIRPGLGERDRLAGHDAADREAAAEALAHEHHIGHDVVVLDREHLPGSPEAGDHLVADEQRADLSRQRAQLAQIAGRRHDVPRGALHRLDDDRGDVVRRLERDLRPQEVDAMPLARRERLAEGAPRAGRVGTRVGTGREGTQTMLEASRQERQHAARLAVEAAPEAHDFVAARGGPGQPQRSEEHTSELQSLAYLVCRLLLEKKMIPSD